VARPYIAGQTFEILLAFRGAGISFVGLVTIHWCSIRPVNSGVGPRWLCPPLYHQTVYWGTFPEQPPDYSPDYTSLSERYTVRPYQATVTVTVPASVRSETAGLVAEMMDATATKSAKTVKK
jgi:hypothetical protein